MGNPLVPKEEVEEVVLPHPLKSVTDEYIYKLKPYRNHAIFTTEGRLYIYSGIEFNKDKLQLCFKYMDDKSVYNTSINQYDFGDAVGLRTFLARHFENIRLARLRFIELRQAFKELNIELVGSNPENIL